MTRGKRQGGGKINRVKTSLQCRMMTERQEEVRSKGSPDWYYEKTGVRKKVCSPDQFVEPQKRKSCTKEKKGKVN